MPADHSTPHISVNALAQPLLAHLLNAPGQDVRARTTPQGVRIVDAGIETRGNSAVAIGRHQGSGIKGQFRTPNP